MNPVRLVIRQPVTVAVGVILIVVSGILAVQRIPVQLTPNVEDTIIAVTTFWEGASPEEIEQEIINEQEEKLQGIANLRAMTSFSRQNEGTIRLEFAVGTSKDVALREVSDKLREVPEYPENADEPVVEASDPESRDYIAWIVLGSTDPDFDVRTLQDFADDRVKPAIERVPGVSEVNVLGGRQREVQIRFDPVHLAQRGITASDLVAAIRGANRNISAGAVPDGQSDVRVRTIGQYESIADVESTVIGYEDGVPILVRDVAEVVEAFKESRSFVRAMGKPVLAINVQREVGTNVMQVMDGVRAAVAQVNAEGGVLAVEAARLGLDGGFVLKQVYDQTVYIEQAIELVKGNIWIGGTLAVLILLLFLRSVASVGIVALAIPISVVGAFVVMVMMGRSINVISLAGMAFAVGMVVDNAIVVLENIYRHLEMGKPPMEAAYDGAREVWGAVLASTLTTIVVFVPILLVQEEAGQLFRDIALAICAAVALSLVVSVSVIPTAAARLLRRRPGGDGGSESTRLELDTRAAGNPLRWISRGVGAFFGVFSWMSGLVPRFVCWACGSWTVRIVIVLFMTIGSLYGSWKLMPPSDYLPSGNRNLVFGLLTPPPGQNIQQQEEIAKRVEETIRPYWEASKFARGTEEYERAWAALPEVASGTPWAPGPKVIPPPIGNYFFVGFGTQMFHGAVTTEDSRVVDVTPLFTRATRREVLPGTMSFAFQLPLFRSGGLTGSAVKVDFMGDDLDVVTRAAQAVYNNLAGEYGRSSVRSDPQNFNLRGPELQIVPNRVRLSEVDMVPTDLGLAVQAAGDGAIIGDYRVGGDTIDLKVISQSAVDATTVAGLQDLPVATPSGHAVALGSLAEVRRVTSPPQINRVNRQRAVSVEFTAPIGVPLEETIGMIDAAVAAERAAGKVPAGINIGYTGSADKLKSVRTALLGDGTLAGIFSSSLFLALFGVYLLMCVLFQSWLRPLVIMFAVPPATFGGFLGLAAVHWWSVKDRYAPVQNLDVLTMLGLVLLIGIVVNNAILIVHQANNFMRGVGEGEGDAVEPMSARDAIAESVRTRVRPIMMTSVTSVFGMLPLVLMPGSGSELYRGMGGVVVGGMLMSTVFTLVLVPLLLSLVLDTQTVIRRVFGRRERVPVGGVPAA
ncbi:MAG: efflux RND transporter permease subunit [Planctomycetota bacterium]|nr:efflux RND transporter permease subunit [Planctomycetota bacterium]